VIERFTSVGKEKVLPGYTFPRHESTKEQDSKEYCSIRVIVEKVNSRKGETSVITNICKPCPFENGMVFSFQPRY
jgi:hypothetical protein